MALTAWVLPLWKAFHNGKSFLACAFATEACLKGITTRYLRATRLFAMLRAARGDGTYFEEIARFAKTALLVIDDFGLTPLEADDRLAHTPYIFDLKGGSRRKVAHLR